MTGFYCDAGAYGTPWPARVLFQSEDGTIYAAADTGLAAVTWGAVVNELGATETPFQTDLVNTLEIALVMASATMASPARCSRLPPTSAAAHPAACAWACTPTMPASPAL